jgi:hypothetical protein
MTLTAQSWLPPMRPRSTTAQPPRPRTLSSSTSSSSAHDDDWGGGREHALIGAPRVAAVAAVYNALLEPRGGARRPWERWPKGSERAREAAVAAGEEAAAAACEMTASARTALMELCRLDTSTGSVALACAAEGGERWASRVKRRDPAPH